MGARLFSSCPRALITVAVSFLTAALLLVPPAGAASASAPRAGHQQLRAASVASHRPMTLVQRRAQVRTDLSPAHVAALARQEANQGRATGRREHLSGSQVRKLMAKQRAYAASMAQQRWAPSRHGAVPAGAATAAPAVRASASPAASTSQPFYSDFWITGPGGVVNVGGCNDECTAPASTETPWRLPPWLH